MIWNPRRGEFRYPVGLAPRTAILVPWFRQTWLRRALNRVVAWRGGTWLARIGLHADGPVEAFPQGWGREAAEFAPQALAGTLEQLLALAVSPDRPALTHSVIVLGRAASPRLGLEARERLWRAFRVPAFEQIIGQHNGEDGDLLAAECEAHNGLHLEAGADSEHGSSWGISRIEMAPCACGRDTPRLVVPEQVHVAAAHGR